MNVSGVERGREIKKGERSATQVPARHFKEKLVGGHKQCYCSNIAGNQCEQEHRRDLWRRRRRRRRKTAAWMSSAGAKETQTKPGELGRKIETRTLLRLQ